LPLVYCVTDQIKQVLLNLINNAAEACEPKHGGIITVQIENKVNLILLTIQDNGIGISQQSIDRIYEPFFSTKPEVKGAGLGLSVSYGIIKSHGWDIKVKSMENIGTTFIIKIPLKTNYKISG
jgi:signal transduction histidine kinase